MLTNILFILSIGINIVLLYGIFNLVRKIESMEDLLDTTLKDTKEHIRNALLVMQNSDINGSFEADDEVGVAFKDIKIAIEELNEKF